MLSPLRDHLQAKVVVRIVVVSTADIHERHAHLEVQRRWALFWIPEGKRAHHSRQYTGFPSTEILKDWQHGPDEVHTCDHPRFQVWICKESIDQVMAVSTSMGDPKSVISPFRPDFQVGFWGSLGLGLSDLADQAVNDKAHRLRRQRRGSSHRLLSIDIHRTVVGPSIVLEELHIDTRWASLFKQTNDRAQMRGAEPFRPQRHPITAIDHNPDRSVPSQRNAWFWGRSQQGGADHSDQQTAIRQRSAITLPDHTPITAVSATKSALWPCKQCKVAGAVQHC